MRYKIETKSILVMFFLCASRLLMHILHIIKLIPQGKVDDNLGPDRLAGPKGSRSQLLQTTNPLIARPLSGSPNCAWY